ncbi:hypothetical protein P171DRAFT_103935 [Karstenula rhodostoma CBS 690.94]|uniref:Uncharacterized protein n=1 Tax=Karstenula rhodostoma CBS 690.94 TaxID=1392251 RepID=A0A9P4PBY9_9PLEO|nr:hypothetical protein P171DRAFT_103935 [Karstenula rhodostoma CBS 690.94]
MPASNKRKAARAAKELAERNAAPDATSTLDQEILDDLPAHENRPDYQHRMAAMFHQFLATLEGSDDPDVKQLMNFVDQYEISKVVLDAVTPTSNVTKQKTAGQYSRYNTAAGPSTSNTATQKSKQNPAGQSSRDNTAAGPSTSNTATQKGKQKAADQPSRYNTAARPSTFNTATQNGKQNPARQSLRDNTAAGPSMSNTTTQKGKQKAVDQPSTDVPTCEFAARWERWTRNQELLRKSKAMQKKGRMKAARNTSQASTATGPSSCDQWGEAVENTQGVTTAGSAKPKESKQKALGQDSSHRTMASSSRDTLAPMLSPLDYNVARESGDPAKANGFT